jgi:hypothetical protein
MTELPKGCELCGDFPVTLRGRCHPSAPLRVSMEADGTLILRCYVPTCNREVVRFLVSPAPHPAPN